MKILLNIPPNIDLGMSEFDIKMTIGTSLYEKGIMSSGLAAEVVGIERYTFIENMGKYGKSILEKTEEELKEDMAVAKRCVR